MKTKTNKIGFVSTNFGHVVDPRVGGYALKKYLNSLGQIIFYTMGDVFIYCIAFFMGYE